MAKIDFKKDFKELYNPSAKDISVVNVPKMNFLMIDGQGDPNTSQDFKDAIEALYPVAYTIKFAIKKSQGINFGVLPMEGLWWADDMNNFDPEKGDKSKWKWTIMIAQPKFVTKNHVEDAISEVQKKKNPKALSKIRFEEYNEGKTVQIMHIGPYSEEGPNIQKMHAYIKDHGFRLSGLHHEIYLSDSRKANPAKMKTILRQPYVKAQKQDS